ncbi:hypothetical protein AV521_00210 [Streptomyces sp. IMTB 2501]|uniref:hypothetical protein n=1 Tax=Streptomyces sp. IMTB 2501 TaxID=1776340 RepID=UPI00096E7637|nr:hypothetical protein [Streptomyces sp. IMTB 2501]OLZ74163.1 hypothetical protein AV521_00210 [Streptomyces sp. IMTB 2501]
MQWTNDNGGAYGEDPYGGAGHVYTYGHQGYGGEGYGGDTATLTWDPVQHAQWTQPHPTTWDAAHGDLLAVPAQGIDTQSIPFVPVPESEPDPDTPEDEPVRPVFVDSSGRRQRLVLRTARLLVIPAGGYVALLISTMLGGSGISAPFVPQPGATHAGTPRVTVPDSASGTGHSAGGFGAAAAHEDARPAVPRPGSGPAGRAAALAAPATTPGTTAAPTTTTAPTPTATRTSKGRALGSSHKPVK